jgi:hypothetical protein
MESVFEIGDLVFSNPYGTASQHFMPGVGKIIYISVNDTIDGTPIYYCEHNGIMYHFTREEIYLYDPS